MLIKILICSPNFCGSTRLFNLVRIFFEQNYYKVHTISYNKIFKYLKYKSLKLYIEEIYDKYDIFIYQIHDHLLILLSNIKNFYEKPSNRCAENFCRCLRRWKCNHCCRPHRSFSTRHESAN